MQWEAGQEQKREINTVIQYDANANSATFNTALRWDSEDFIS